MSGSVAPLNFTATLASLFDRQLVALSGCPQRPIELFCCINCRRYPAVAFTIKL
ncbi:MAG: hypothetical protein ICV61_16785 [Microcoleus sp. Co-bin12]|nr:hypothetical protein [Microcoleus sp. Co-bin12]